MRRHHIVSGLLMLAVAGTAVAPAAAQDQAATITAEVTAETAAPIVDAQPAIAQAAEAAPPAKMSMMEKAAAVAGAVAAGAAAFKGLSALFKSGKKAQPAPVAAIPAPVN